MSELKVKIGVAESSRVVEIDVDDIAGFEKRIAESFEGGPGVLWFEDTKQRRVGIPRDRIAFVEIDQEEDRPVGFG